MASAKAFGLQAIDVVGIDFKGLFDYSKMKKMAFSANKTAGMVMID